MTALYYAFAAGLAAGFVLTIGCVAVMAVRKLGEEDLPPSLIDRSGYFNVLELIEMESRGAEPAIRRTLNRLHARVLGLAQTPCRYQD